MDTKIHKGEKGFTLSGFSFVDFVPFVFKNVFLYHPRNPFTGYFSAAAMILAISAEIFGSSGSG
jgi:hypothetical protein